MQQQFKRVMLIDDDTIDNFVAEKIILHTGFASEVIVKNSAIEAIDYLKAYQDDITHLPEFIFLDLRMPLNNGFDFLKAFDRYPSHINTIPVIFLSVSVNHSDIQRALMHKAVIKYVAKPISEIALMELFTAHTEVAGE